LLPPSQAKDEVVVVSAAAVVAVSTGGSMSTMSKVNNNVDGRVIFQRFVSVKNESGGATVFFASYLCNSNREHSIHYAYEDIGVHHPGLSVAILYALQLDDLL
jgi:hypothetical protein